MTTRDWFPPTAAILVAAVVALFLAAQTAGAHSDMTMPGMQQGHASSGRHTLSQAGPREHRSTGTGGTTSQARRYRL